jgi:hypothetical protein
MEGDMADEVSRVPEQAKDDVLTVVAISFVAEMLGDVVHEGLGHAAVALLTGAKSGVLSTVAWSSEGDSRLVAAGGTLANLAAGLVFWIVLRRVTRGSVRSRFFLLTSLAFNLFAGTGYFFFSGVTNFGDWAAVIDGLPAHWLWRSLLVDSLLFGGGAFKCGWTLESDWDSVDVAIRFAGCGGGALWASVVDVLHSERDSS